MKLLKRLDNYINKKFDLIKLDTGYPKNSAIDWVCSQFIYRHKTPEERIRYILHCMFDSDDEVVRSVIYDVVNERYPEYKSVIENPNKYRILL